MAKDAASWDELGEKILAAARNELYLNLPFLDAALCALTPSREEATDFLATDAKRLFYSGSYLAMRYEKGRSLVCRAYLHLLLHCLLRHPPAAVPGARRRFVGPRVRHRCRVGA